MTWPIAVGIIAALLLIGGVALMASAFRTHEDDYWGAFNWDDPKWQVARPGEAIPITREGTLWTPVLTHEQRFLVALNEIGNEVEREVFPATETEKRWARSFEFWKGAHYTGIPSPRRVRFDYSKELGRG